MKIAIPITNSLLGEYIVDLNTTAAVGRNMNGHVRCGKSVRCYI